MPITFMAFTHADKIRFEPFFLASSIEALHESLSPTEFERFLGYVFFCAGFEVEHVASVHIPYGPGVDLNLYENTAAVKPFARVEARRYAPNGPSIGVNDVFKFAGVLISAGQEPGYMITTAHFAPNVQHIIKRPGLKDVHLIDGDELLRYLMYLYGSRVSDGQGFHRTLTPILPDWLFNDLAHEQRTRSHILAVANNKGGVGKTTSALNVGFALAAQGQRVLLVDMDGQANLTSVLPPRLPVGTKLAPGAPQPSHQRVITEHFAPSASPLQPLIQQTRFDRIWILAANEELARIDPGGSANPDAELAFARALRHPNLGIPTGAADAQNSLDAFDWIVIDTPPALSHFARLALAAADYVLVPLKADSFSVAGINRALRASSTMHALTGVPQGRGLLLTQWRSVKSMRDIEAKLNFQAPISGYPMLDIVIPYDDHIEQAHISLINGGVKTLFGWRATVAATAYKKVADEIARKVG